MVIGLGAEQWYTRCSVRAEPGVCSTRPTKQGFCQWSLRFIQRNSKIRNYEQNGTRYREVVQ
jgi:hypothetical protein